MTFLRRFLASCFAAVSLFLSCCDVLFASPPEYDVVIYGGTSAGIAAAVQVKRMGGTVVVIEPTSRVGGLTTGGLGQTDIGNKAAIGGISREFYQRVRKHYDRDSSWVWQEPNDYRSGGQSRTNSNEDTMWTFEPSVALKILQDFIAEHDILVVYNERLDRDKGGLDRDGEKIVGMRTENGKRFSGKTFIDATYEGDLLAAAGVSYIVGREANSVYGETVSGVQTRHSIHHQFVPNVDPYVTAGDPESGLLPGIDPTGPGVEESGDHRVQAYCFRMCLTDHPDNRIPFRKPDDYVDQNYELLFRNFEAGATALPWSNSSMPNRKTDVNNNKGFSTDYIGQNYSYPDAGYDEREAIVARHLSYQQGLMWALANHPRVPENIRSEVSRWGTCKDEFEREDGWQQQLYIREARRMIGDVVMTQHHCQGRVVSEKPIGLAAYTMDSHNVQRHVGTDGFVHNEGDIQVGGFSPYSIDYGAIVPEKQQCSNLLVPVCLSASHMAFGSIRMEPVFMVLGQSAATAAMHSVQQHVAVQDIDFSVLETKLKTDKQVLLWTGPKRKAATSIRLKSIPGAVVDDQAAKRSGFESISTSNGPYVGLGYRHDSNDNKGKETAVYHFKVAKPGKYALRMAYTAHPNRASNVPILVTQNGIVETYHINQRSKPDHGAFGTVAELTLTDTDVSVTISNQETNGYVIADAVQLLSLQN